LSTLTKVLIVLQTVFAIFLCGIVVTYVGNASNYKEKYTSRDSEARRAKTEEANTREQWQQDIADRDKKLAEAKADIERLSKEKSEVQLALNESERSRNALLGRVDGVVAKMESAVNSADEINKSYATTQRTLDELRAEQIRLKQELKETNDLLIQKMAIITTQDEQIRNLTEQKTEITQRLEKSMRDYGLAPAAAKPVTTVSSRVQPAGPVQEIALKGRITNLDMESSLAEISIGTEAGVREKMRFHVTRGSEYLCDIQIVAVDTEKAVGSLEMVKGTPRVGDPISTNF
jgi:hypothetical protein